MIRRYYYHAVFSWVYKNYKSFLAVITDDILMETEDRIYFKILRQEFDTLFDHTFKELPNLNYST